MNDVTGGAGGAAGGDGGAGAGGAGAAAIAGAGGGEGTGGQASGGAAPSWRDDLPETIRGDASLANFADIGALAQGYIETKRTASERIDGYKTDEGLKKFGEIVRPATAADYEISVPDGFPTKKADAFRDFAFGIGMPPQWAKAIVDFNNEQDADDLRAAEEASQADVDQLRNTMGADKFDTSLQAVRQMLEKSGVELAAEDMAHLDTKIGSSNLLKWMFDMAARVGDPGPVEGAGGASGGGQAMTPEAASSRWDVAVKDANWRKQAQIKGTPEFAESERLQNLIAQGRARKTS
ncbi:hypothetical protein M9978_08330 [Sphingomonas sp. MG17]|uniref:Phage T7 capsid assembly protein n=1 Tax=Sphingomonas tagetis TaxID=2949092 RepID=A0A9X2KKE2_9SPHN|nr:hypothetical protein [Sphingomonas tagetis]MCP3730434.1 hypothetical protein [Sphingomonas tagetis]